MRITISTILLLLYVAVASVGQTVNGKMSIEWKRGEDIPQPRGGYFAAWHNGGLWLAGGSFWKDGKKLWTSEASFYDAHKGKWSSRKPLPKAFGYGVTAAIGRDIYILGGVDESGKANREVFRLRAENWERVGESPAEFIYPSYATVGSKVYVFGGSSSPTDVSRATSNVWIYDTRTAKWGSGPPIPGDPRQIFSAAAVGEDIFVFGGITQKTGEKAANLDDAFRFDTKSRAWSKIKKMPIAMRAFWAVSDGRAVYLIGGYSDAGLDTVYRYSPEQDEYELVSRLPQPLMDTKFIFSEDSFYGASGEDKLASRFPGIVIGKLKRK